MRTTKGITCWPGVVGALALLASPAGAQDTPEDGVIVLTGGFRDHLEPAKGGRIDWANGHILAEGVGRATGRSDQEQLMAQRAAEMIAARNALAMAKGIQIDSTGRVAGLRDGAVRIQGVIRGHKIVETRWLPNADPPQCKVTLRVPLWGVGGIASLFWPEQRARLRRSMVPRVGLTREQAAVSDLVLVLDTRGHDASPCLFPEIVDTSGRVLYDVTTLSSATAARVPAARYVESSLAFERLQTMIQLEAPLQFMLVGFYPEQENTAKPAPKRGMTQPASRPAEHTRRRARRRMAVRVARIAGRQKTQLVLTREDAERLGNSPKAASAMRKAQVLIVVDAPAAGTEGRLPVPLFESLAVGRAD